MSTVTIRPSRIQAGSSNPQALTLTLAGAGWVSGSTVFSLSGPARLVTAVVNNTGRARLVVKTNGESVGTLAVSAGLGNSGSTSVVAISPTRRRWFPALSFWRRERE
jgi:hypothetical protein